MNVECGMLSECDGVWLIGTLPLFTPVFQAVFRATLPFLLLGSDPACDHFHAQSGSTGSSHSARSLLGHSLKVKSGIEELSLPTLIKVVRFHRVTQQTNSSWVYLLLQPRLPSR